MLSIRSGPLLLTFAEPLIPFGLVSKERRVGSLVDY
jgi:hypothetical protein